MGNTLYWCGSSWKPLAEDEGGGDQSLNMTQTQPWIFLPEAEARFSHNKTSGGFLWGGNKARWIFQGFKKRKRKCPKRDDFTFRQETSSSSSFYSLDSSFLPVGRTLGRRPPVPPSVRHCHRCKYYTLTEEGRKTRYDFAFCRKLLCSIKLKGKKTKGCVKTFISVVRRCREKGENWGTSQNTVIQQHRGQSIMWGDVLAVLFIEH